MMVDEELIDLLSGCIRLAAKAVNEPTPAASMREAQLRVGLHQIDRIARHAIKDARLRESASTHGWGGKSYLPEPDQGG